MCIDDVEQLYIAPWAIFHFSYCYEIVRIRCLQQSLLIDVRSICADRIRFVVLKINGTGMRRKYNDFSIPWYEKNLHYKSDWNKSCKLLALLRSLIYILSGLIRSDLCKNIFVLFDKWVPPPLIFLFSSTKTC